MSKLMECINKNEETSDSIRISGHEVSYICVVVDKDTDRAYFISQCINCGKIDPVYCQASSEFGRDMISRRTVVRTIGGDIHKGDKPVMFVPDGTQ